VTSPNPGFDNRLIAVTSTSRTDAWAVGDSAANGGNDHTLVLHWNGVRWRQVAAPRPGAVSFLSDVAASSPRDALAVGTVDAMVGSGQRTLALHWNGKKWSQVASPNPGSRNDELSGVAVSSGKNAWAVGSSGDSAGSRTLVLHWNGSRWQRVPSPAPGTSSGLQDIDLDRSGGVWAVGIVADETSLQPLAIHCC
jgi:hypothetical protein